MAVTELPRVAQDPDEPERPAVTAPAKPKPAGGGHMPYFPALDGLRGLAVVSVLFFHAGFSWAVGGYLGVSTFFTLSGFLITSLLLAERTATGTVDFAGFWIRRFRRLMPAALAAMALAIVVVVLTASAIDPTARKNIGGDVISGLTYVANWRFILGGKSYAELFSGVPSPMLHFWSLAIEEQFYLLYPLLVFAILKVTKGSRAGFAAVLVGLIGVSVAVPVVFGYSVDRLYYGTDARAAELLMGGLLAVVLNYRRVTTWLARDYRAQYVFAALGAAALVVCAVLWATIDQQSTDLWHTFALHAGFFGYSVLTVLVILSALLPIGPVTRLLSTSPLRWLGKISYGIYLYHWPIFLLVRQRYPDLSTPVFFAVAVAITLGVALLSFRYLEMPIRRGQPLFRRTSLPLRPGRLAPVAIITLAAVAVIVGLTAPKPAIDFEAAAQQLEFSPAPPPPQFDPNSVAPPHPRVAMFGDSTALETGFGLNSYFHDTGKADLVAGVTELGCSILRNSYKMDVNGMGRNVDACDHWDTTWKAALDKGQPNIAMVQVGPWEVVDHKWPGDKDFSGIGDKTFDDRLRNEMLAVTDMLSSGGAQVYWLNLPKIGAPEGQDAKRIRGAGADPKRAQRFNEILAELPGLRPGKVRVFDLATYLDKSGDDRRLRPDGVHFSGDTAREVAEKWLVPEILSAFNEDWLAHKKAEFDQAQSAAPLPPPRVLVAGDSAALGLAMGMDTYAHDNKVWQIGSVTQIGCGIGRGGSRKNHDTTEAVPKECQTWETDWPKMLDKLKPDIVVVMNGLWDVTDRQLPNDRAWRGPGDPVYDDYLRSEFAKAADVLHSRGAPVVWLTFPAIDLGRNENRRPDKPYSANDPARMARMNDIVREVANSRPWMHVADLAAYAKTFPKGELDPDLRPDGVHFTTEAAQRLSKDWLAAQVLDVYTAERRANPTTTTPGTPTTSAGPATTEKR